MNAENDAWGKRFYDKLRPQKFFWSVHQTSLDAAIH